MYVQSTPSMKPIEAPTKTWDGVWSRLDTRAKGTGIRITNQLTELTNIWACEISSHGANGVVVKVSRTCLH